MTNVYLKKALRSIYSHSAGYGKTWGFNNPAVRPPRTGDFCRDYDCYPETLAAAFEREYRQGFCSCCRRPYTSLRQVSLDLWYPDWSIMCCTCNSRRGSKTPAEWEAYKKLHYGQPELALGGLTPRAGAAA